MDTTTRIIGHPTLRIGELAPDRKAAFSPNLHQYLRRRGHFFDDGGLLDAVYGVRAGTRTAEQFGARTLLLGFRYEGDFVGSRLLAVLCQGSKAPRFAHALADEDLEPVDGFWDRYLELGRCAIDPGHQEQYVGAVRFKEDADARTCLWCGHRQRKLVTRRVVEDISWIDA